MNSQERVHAAIAHKNVDKVPLGLYAIDYDIVEKLLGRPTFVRNKIALQMAFWEGRRDEVVQSLKRDVEEIYRKLDCVDLILCKEAQIVPPKNYIPDPPLKIGEGKWQDRQGRIFQAVWDTNEIACINDPVENEKKYSIADFTDDLKVPAFDDSQYEVFDHIINIFGKDKYIASFTGGITALNQLGGMSGFSQKSLLMYIMEPEIVLASNRQSVKLQNELDKFHIRPGTCGLMVEQDMAGTNAPLISPDMFREFCLPFLKERITQIKKYSSKALNNSQVILHNCGNNMPLMDMFIECGIDCYQSLQTTAGMDIAVLKQKWGKSMSFWGGVPVENLISGTMDDVRKDVRKALETGAPCSGFILGPSHSIAKNTKYDNFMAMLDEFVKLRDKF